MNVFSDDEVINIDYINYKGERSVRRIHPIKVWFGETKYHEGPQDFLMAIDIEKRELRDFACKDIVSWTPAIEDADMDVDYLLREVATNYIGADKGQKIIIYMETYKFLNRLQECLP